MSAANDLGNVAPPTEAPAEAPAAAETPTNTPVETPNWTDGLPDDMKGFVEKKGFKDPSSVLDSYRNLEKLLGGPKEKMVQLPDSDDAEGMNALFDKLGRPKEATEYGLKLPESLGEEESKPFIDWAQGTFHELGLSASQANTLMEKYGEYHKGQLDTFDQEYQTSLKNQQDALAQEWGAAQDQNLQIARSAMQSFGISAEQVDTMEQAMGYDGVMKFLHGIGSKIGEHSFEGGDKKTNGIMTPAAAKQEIDELKSDRGFQDKLFSKDAAARRQWDQLHVWAYPQQ